MKQVVIFLFVALPGLFGCSKQESETKLTFDSQATRYIVKTKESVETFSEGDRAAQLQSKAGYENRVETIDHQFFVIDFGANTNTIHETLERLKNSSDIEYIEPDGIAYAIHQPNDPQWQSQWAHLKIQSPQAWDLGQGSHSVVVAVIDTGFDYTHQDLAANVWTNTNETPGNGRDDDGNGLIDDYRGFDFANNDSDPMADDSPTFHGTHVAGTIGAVGNNGIGITGHSPVVKIMGLKFLGANGQGQISNAIRAINYAVSKRVKIISNSWGSNQSSQALGDAIARARGAGILFVAASGNGGSDGVGDNNDSVPNYPSNYTYDNVVAVAATGQNDQLTRFSNFGFRTVHVAAPGEGILSLRNGNQYQYLSGTSMATPLVSGVLALMMARRPDLNYQQIRQILFSNVDTVPGLQGRVATNGRVNAYKAMQALAVGATPSPTPIATPPPTATPRPSPTPKPTMTPLPTPTPVPGLSTARAPTIFGQTLIVLTNINQQIAIDYDVSEFMKATAVYFEVSKPNQGFSDANGTTPDPNRLLWAQGPAPSGRFFILPATQLPGWGTYSLRIIPINSVQQPIGRFSNSSVIFLRQP
jgi:subtilisin family serine protease